jgi:hypothetical protein
MVHFEGHDDDPDFVPDLEMLEVDKVLEIKASTQKSCLLLVTARHPPEA